MFLCFRVNIFANDNFDVVIVDLPLFVVSSALIGDSRKLLFCNSVRLLDKVLGNISKRAVVEKKPSTREKDKEGRNIMKTIQGHLF